jgi:hypothetical protein
VDEALAAVLQYTFICELYTFLFTFVLSSVSIGLLLVLQSGQLRDSDLDTRYRDAEMLEARLARLVENRFLEIDADGYRLTEKSKRLVRLFHLLSVAFRHDHAAPDAELLGARSRTPR